MTIEEIRLAKRRLEVKVNELFYDFRKETDIAVVGIVTDVSPGDHLGDYLCDLHVILESL